MISASFTLCTLALIQALLWLHPDFLQVEDVENFYFWMQNLKKKQFFNLFFKFGTIWQSSLRFLSFYDISSLFLCAKKRLEGTALDTTYKQKWKMSQVCLVLILKFVGAGISCYLWTYAFCRICTDLCNFSKLEFSETKGVNRVTNCLNLVTIGVWKNKRENMLELFCVIFNVAVV